MRWKVLANAREIKLRIKGINETKKNKNIKLKDAINVNYNVYSIFYYILTI